MVQNLASALALLFLLTSCATSQSEPATRVIVQREYLAPEDARVFEDCTAPRVSARLDAELERMATLIRCERGRNAALRAWRDELSAQESSID